MNLFRTEVFPETYKQKINYHDPVMLLGSCFSNNIGSKFSHFCFNVKTNPFGVLYNPASINNAIKILLSNKEYTEEDLDNHNNLWFSFDHYSGFSDVNPKSCLDKINHELKSAQKFLLKTKYLIITLGTSWTYKHKQKNKIVANCHKIPASAFERFFLKSDDIVNEFSETLDILHNNFPELNIIFTVSPVRHLKDGAVGNQISKSNLLIAIHQLVTKYNFTSYFPTYEIMMDDLRDYRFYADDMIHPSEPAINYIWGKFLEEVIDNSCVVHMKTINKLNQAANHRPFNPNTEEHKKFLKHNLTKAISFKQETRIDIAHIIEKFQNQINLHYD